MRMEVHVHGSLYLCKGVTQAQVEAGLRKWLDYLDVDNIAEVKSLEQGEPGIAWDHGERILDLCWTGEVGRGFHQCLEDTFTDLGPLTERATEVEVTYYHDNGDDEIQMMFVGPSPEAIHQAQRRRMIEDVGGLLARHFDPNSVAEVTAVIDRLFDRDWARYADSAGGDLMTTEHMIRPGHKHLH